MSGWWCCCGCYTFTDPFTGADHSNPATADWEECSGDWEIYKDTLATPDADAVISLKHMVGWPVGIMQAEVLITSISKGINSFGGTAQIFAYVGSVGTPCSGTTGTWRLELSVVDSDTGVLSLYDDTDTLVGDRDVVFQSGTCTMTLCVAWDETLEKGEITGSCTDMLGVQLWTCHDTMPDYYFALGNKTATTDQVYYESATYTDHYDHNSACPDCTISCCCPCIEAEDQQPTLTATVVATEATDTCWIGGESTTLECGAVEGNCCDWAAATPLSLICEIESETHTLSVVMTCETEGCGGYRMTLSWPGSDGGNAGYCLNVGDGWPQTRYVLDDPPCTCIPFYVRFGPFRLWRNPAALGDPHACHCCTEFWVDVSE
jgi:hypothetical protein